MTTFCSWFLWSRCFSNPIISLQIPWKWLLACVLWSPFSMHVLSCRTEAAAGARPGYSHSQVPTGEIVTSAIAWQNMILAKTWSWSMTGTPGYRGKKGLCWAFLISLGTTKCSAWLLGAKIRYHMALLSPQLLLHSLTFPQAAAG